MKYRVLFISGILTALIPFLGFPNSWRRVMLLILGLIVMYTAYLLYKAKKRARILSQRKIETYTDSTPQYSRENTFNNEMIDAQTGQ